MMCEDRILFHPSIILNLTDQTSPTDQPICGEDRKKKRKKDKNEASINADISDAFMRLVLRGDGLAGQLLDVGLGPVSLAKAVSIST